MSPGGIIVNVASTAGLGFGVHGVPEYAVAKAGVMRLSPLHSYQSIFVHSSK